MQRYLGTVGKRMGNYLYIHRKYVYLINPDLADEIEKIPFDFNLVKIDLTDTTTEVTVINCVEFDTVHEPRVGKVTKFVKDNRVGIFEKSYDYLVYHHKWMFVTDDYDGFDVKESKARSEEWMKYEPPRNKIGYRHFWIDFLETVGMQP